MVDGFVATCSFIPYALVALGLRLVMARVFFLDGQTRIEGPPIPRTTPTASTSPSCCRCRCRPETIADFLTITAMPIPPVFAAYLVSYGEFILPIMLLLGLGTRFAALGLLLMTAFFQFYVMPDALWSTDIYWAALLLVLLSRGPGALSLDHFIRLATREASAMKKRLTIAIAGTGARRDRHLVDGGGALSSRERDRGRRAAGL